MIVICAWCKTVISENYSNTEKGVSHGICHECYTKELEIIAQLHEDEYQDAIAAGWTT